MPWVLLPEWTAAMIAFHTFLAINAVGVGWAVRSGVIKLRYSKFRAASGISGRAGMFILYAVPLVVQTLVAASYLGGASTIQGLLFAAVTLHFAKRCLEVLFVHSYSGPIDVATTASVAVNYSLFAGVMSYFHARTIAAIDALFVVGGVLFVVGQLTNLVHHVILARLRKDNSGYFVPEAGLFRLVAAPHYLGEIVAWIGVALMSRHLATYLVVSIMAHYLVDRADSTLTWYRQKFPEYPAARRRLIPFVY